MSTHPSAPPPSYDAATGPEKQDNYGYGMGAHQAGYNTAGQPMEYPPAQPTGYATEPTGYATEPSGYTTQPTGYTNWGNTTAGQVNPDMAQETISEVSYPMGNMSSFSDKNIRRNFIKKVYLILMAQLLFTFGCAAVFSLIDGVKLWVQGVGAPLYYVSYATFFVTYFVLVCCPSVRRKTPGNYICLGVFTLVFSYMVGTISSFYDTYSVLIAAGITALVCLSVSLFAIQTKIDFTMCSGMLFVLVMVLFFFGWSVMIVYFTIGFSYILHCVYAGVAALVFTLFLVYDTQMIVGGRKHELSPEEYIYGALQLYIDVVYIFLIILSLFGSKN